jgi:hypothetical protein
MVRCRKNRNILSYGIAWGIWLARNNLIFNSKQPNWDTVFDLILRRLAMLLKSSVKNFSYTGNDLDAKVLVGEITGDGFETLRKDKNNMFYFIKNKFR